MLHKLKEMVRIFSPVKITRIFRMTCDIGIGSFDGFLSYLFIFRSTKLIAIKLIVTELEGKNAKDVSILIALSINRITKTIWNKKNLWTWLNVIFQRLWNDWSWYLAYIICTYSEIVNTKLLITNLGQNDVGDGCKWFVDNLKLVTGFYFFGHQNHWSP